MCAGMWISPFRKILIVPGRAGSMQGISAQLGSTGFVLLRVYVERFLSVRDADVTLSQCEKPSACVCRQADSWLSAVLCRMYSNSAFKNTFLP